MTTSIEVQTAMQTIADRVHRRDELLRERVKLVADPQAHAFTKFKMSGGQGIQIGVPKTMLVDAIDQEVATLHGVILADLAGVSAYVHSPDLSEPAPPAAEAASTEA